MTNELFNAYFKVDQFLVDRATEAVKAWNWTTGRTRAELADVVNLGATGAYFTANPVLGLGFSLITGIYHRNNKKKDLLEQDLHDTKHKYVDELNFSYGFSSPLFMGFSAHSFNNSDISRGIADLLFATQGYIMRAEYQKPRKNCVKRGLERLSEMVKQPAMEAGR